MSIENDLRQRQNKKKIFAEQIVRSKLEDKNVNDNILFRRTQEYNVSSKATEQLREKLEELSLNNSELKKLLREERQRYDKLFEDYEDLIEKNSVIEKEYINLKYQHNKEMKQMKKNMMAHINEQVEKIIQEFYHAFKEEKTPESLRVKIQKYSEKLKQFAKSIVRSNKSHRRSEKKKQQYYEQGQNRRSHLSQKSNIEQREQKVIPFSSFDEAGLLQKSNGVSNIKQIQFFDINQQPIIDKVQISPSKQKELMNLQSMEVNFEDEYYGQIEDFNHYEEKVMQRRNYELLKKNNRNSNDIKRKKIFDSMG